MKIIDAHSHIDYITHTFQPDVVGTICCAKNESEWADLLNMANQDNNIYPSFGIHPWFIDSVSGDFENRLIELLKTNQAFMIGEIGLDKYHSNMDKQIDVFNKQLDISVKLKRTVFLHCVGAWDKILHILKQYKKSELPIIVMHAFNGSNEICSNLLENYNVLFSFNKIDKSHDLPRIEQIPSDKILVESDGKQNVILRDVIDNIASIKHNENMSNIIYSNTKKVLKNG